MPQIASVLPSVTPASPAQPQQADTASAAPSFLSQLKTALTHLSAAIVPHPATPGSATDDPSEMPGASPADTSDSNSKLGDHAADVLPDALAALGLMLVPAAFHPILSAPGTPAPADGTGPGTVAVPLSEASALLGPGGVHAGAALDAAPSAAPTQAATPASTAGATASLLAQQALQAGGASSPGTHVHSSRGSHARGDQVTGAESVAPGAAPDPMVMTTTPPTGGITAPLAADQAAPSAVVNQIARQADLYRLPGTRGVRIQLHPDDLGGVQVTVKYGVSGGIELHISAEHASTAALVQSGWTELRDALANQGISPDRLLMSVTAPAAAGQMDFSNRGGGGSSAETAFADFNNNNGNNNQGQAHQQNAEQQRAAQGRPGGVDDVGHVSVATLTSRIDYHV